MANPERNPDAVFNFLGRAAQDQPEVLESLPPRDRYILLAHSDIKNARTLAEMTTIFDASTSTVGRAYKRALTTVYESVSAQLQEAYPLERITESIRIRHAEKTAEDSRERFSDPEKRQEIIEKMSEGHRRSYRNNPELRQKTSRASTGRHHTEETKEKIRAKLKGRKRPISVYISTIGVERTPEVKARISATQKRRLQNPKERKKAASFGFKGKQHSPEEKLKMGKPRGLKAKRHHSDGAIRRWVKEDRGIASSEDLSLWKYAIAHNMIHKIVEAGFLTQAEADALREHFESRKKIPALQRLLNKFSLAVANLS